MLFGSAYNITIWENNVLYSGSIMRTPGCVGSEYIVTRAITDYDEYILYHLFFHRKLGYMDKSEFRKKGHNSGILWLSLTKNTCHVNITS